MPRVSGPTIVLGEGASEWITTANGLQVQRISRIHLSEMGAEQDLPDDFPDVVVDIDLGPDGTQSRVPLVELRAPEGVRGEHFRLLGARWDRHLVPYFVQRIYRFASAPSEGGPLDGPESRQASVQAVRSYRRQRAESLTRELLGEVADVYTDEHHHTTCDRSQCKGVPQPRPRQRVATHFGLKPDGASVRIREARAEGLLAPYTTGKGGRR
jgi:hypothetical protein